MTIDCDRLLTLDRAWHRAMGGGEHASYLMGETPIRMMAFAEAPNVATEAALEALIAGNVAHPARELMWGSPGTLLAALFLFERTGSPRWADLLRTTARQLRSRARVVRGAPLRLLDAASLRPGVVLPRRCPWLRRHCAAV